MNRRLERDGLASELATVTALLAARSEEEDPVGWQQFSVRRREIEQRLASLAAVPDTKAAVAVFFGGRPVIGSHGVAADFGGKALDLFQGLVSTQLAAQEGPVGARGPLPLWARAQLVLTDVARGSFGFVLEEASPDGNPLDTPLKEAVDSAIDLFYRIASPDEEAFEAATEAVDSRVLSSIKSFAKLLDDSGATLRFLESERELTFQRDFVERARQRSETLEVAEGQRELVGRLYVLPEAKRFELHPTRPGGDSLRGTISPEALRRMIDQNGEVREGIIGSEWVVQLATREIRIREQAPRFSYKLLEIGPPEARQPIGQG